MTVQLIQHPFTLDRGGAVHTAEAGSDEQITTGIAAIVGTRIGQRPMVWAFGIPDPAFGSLTAEDVRAGVAGFGPDGVIITGVTNTAVDDETSTAVVSWKRA